MTVEKPGHDTMPGRTPLIANRNNIRTAFPDAVTPFAIGNMTFPAILHGQFSNFLHDTSGRGIDPYHRINLQQFFHLSVKAVKRLIQRAMTFSSE